MRVSFLWLVKQGSQSGQLLSVQFQVLVSVPAFQHTEDMAKEDVGMMEKPSINYFLIFNSNETFFSPGNRSLSFS